MLPSIQPVEAGDEEFMTGVEGEESFAVPIRKVPQPRQPSDEERAQHCISHVPERAWCEACIRGRGKEDAHWRRTAEQAHDRPVVQLDYFLMGGQACLAICESLHGMGASNPLQRGSR